jgi:hypothetical protein
MSEQSISVCKKCPFEVLWAFISAGIFVLWQVFIFLQCFCKNILNGDFLDIIPHVVFLSLFSISAIVSYKIFKIQSEMREKENEFQRKREMENLQLEKYEKNKKQKRDNSDMEAKMKEICESFMEEKEYSYNENLKKLRSNLKLFSDVKEIIETRIENKNT